MLPLAVLTNTPDQAQTLRQVAERIDGVTDLRVQSNVAASTRILAGLTLKKDFINQVLRKDIMQQSVIYQEWKEELLQEGRQEGECSLVLRQLTCRIGHVSPEMRSQIQALSLDQLDALGEALLDFSEPRDLVNWLQDNQSAEVSKA